MIFFFNFIYLQRSMWTKCAKFFNHLHFQFPSHNEKKNSDNLFIRIVMPGKSKRKLNNHKRNLFFYLYGKFKMYAKMGAFIVRSSSQSILLQLQKKDHTSETRNLTIRFSLYKKKCLLIFVILPFCAIELKNEIIEFDLYISINYKLKLNCKSIEEKVKKN